MSDTNSIHSIVKILEIPNQILLNKNLFTRFRVQLPQARGNKIINLTFWGNLARDVCQYYTINDYLIIEGYVSLRHEQLIKNQSLKKVEVTVLRVYPLLLSYDCSYK